IMPEEGPAAGVRLDRQILSTTVMSGIEVGAQPRIVGTTFTEDGQRLIFQASPLRGLTLERPEQAVGLVGLTSFDAARLMQDLEQGLPLPQIGAPFQTPFDVLERDRLAAEESRGIPETMTAAPRMDTTLQPAYQAILE